MLLEVPRSSSLGKDLFGLEVYAFLEVRRWSH